MFLFNKDPKERHPFRPNREPESIIYDAFHKEAEKRKEYKLGDNSWIKNERNAVFLSLCNYANKKGLKKPEISQVKQAENYALGSIDYSAKWAYKLVELWKESLKENE